MELLTKMWIWLSFGTVTVAVLDYGRIWVNAYIIASAVLLLADYYVNHLKKREE